ncbi:ribose-phosphate pyrophosphokinase-like domain-containing protein [Achromobacter sp. ES-001]|uniref:phosphoribosyltransferase family protein n=1 Tax=Achromobacter sp. ES-001 TaxID=2860286 RepID=UPI001C63E845|nr:phosphoribosyltransferase family protein [Achromobacter sp. ES-001]QYJ20642.1 ribose-phosphate pyrophosphokinase-like domain-containing protein [Achromobacter sp. ES-001]
MFTITAVVEGQRQTETPTAFVFPGGESQVTVPAGLRAAADAATEFRIHALLKAANDVMQLLMLTDALRRLNPAVPVHLDMPYVPYARQDRVCNPGEALGAAVFCKLINDQQYATVTITEPHSDVTPALLQRVRVVDAAAFVGRALAAPAFAKGVTLMAPDAGARKRVQALAKKLGVADVRYAEKVRDPQTGRITETRVPDDIPDQPILVVDDICDGGRTFLELALALADKTRQPLYLYVTHGIFSHGLTALNERYAGVFTAYDWTLTDGDGAPVCVGPDRPTPASPSLAPNPQACAIPALVN